MERFRYLSKAAVQRELESLVGGWSSANEDPTTFLDWAWLVASASDTFAAQNKDACAALLRDETEALERVIRARSTRLATQSEELSKKRAFLEYLGRQVRS